MSVNYSASRRDLWHAHKWAFLMLTVIVAVALWATVFVRNAPNRRAQQHIDAGMEFVRNGQTGKAERELLAAAKLTPNNADLWDLLSELYIRTEQWGRGTAALRQLLRVAPMHPYIYSRLAACALRSGNELEAQKLALEELKRNPGDEASLSILAFLSDMQQNSEQHIDYLRRLLARGPDDPETLLSLAQAYYEAGKFAEAMPITDHLLAIKPSDSVALAIRGAARSELDATPASSALSEADLFKSLQFDPLYALARFSLGRVYLRSGQYQKAIFQLEVAQKLYPRKMEVPFELATAYARAGKAAKAAATRKRFETLRREVTQINVLQKKCSLDKNNFEAHLQLGKFFLNAEDHRKALYYIQRAVQLEPKSSEAKAAFETLMRQLNNEHPAQANSSQSNSSGKNSSKAHSSTVPF